MLFTPIHDYRWAADHNVALGSLTNVELDIGRHNRRKTGDGLRRVGIASQPVDRFPIRTEVLVGYERGDGKIDHEWQMILATLGLKYVLDTYLSSGAVVSVPVTIYTRLHEFASYGRYNAYLTLPSRRRGDIEYLRQNVFRVVWKFTSLQAL